jgi:hypothetical protein
MPPPLEDMSEVMSQRVEAKKTLVQQRERGLQRPAKPKPAPTQPRQAPHTAPVQILTTTTTTSDKKKSANAHACNSPKCPTPGAATKACSACTLGVRYCSRACQSADRASHKAACKANGKKKKSKHKPKQEADGAIPIIKPKNKPSAQQGGIFDDVQNLKNGRTNQMLGEMPDTNQMLRMVQERPDLMEKLKTPKIAAAMAAFGKDSKAALEQYKDDEEVAVFMRDWMKMMKIDVKLDEYNAKQEAKLQQMQAPAMERVYDPKTHMQFGDRWVSKVDFNRWMADPLVRQALADPQVQFMMGEMGKDTAKIVQFHKHPGIRVLVKAGVLDVPAAYR